MRSPAIPSPEQTPKHGAVLSRLREALLDAQYELHAQGREGLLLLTTGLPLAGRTEALGQIVQWLNPKLLSTHAMPPTAGAPGAPCFRWWPSVPARGRISVVYDGWYEDLWQPRAEAMPVAGAALRTAAKSVNAFETLLVHEHVRLLKWHFHVARGLQRRRLHHYLADPAKRWRVGEDDLWFVRHYHSQVRHLRTLQDLTDRAGAAWQIIDEVDSERAVARGARSLLGALRRAISAPPAAPIARPPRAKHRYTLPSVATPVQQRALRQRPLEAAQGELALQSRRRAFQDHSLAIVLEGMDAAGKSQAIRRLTEALDPRQYTVVPAGVPTEDERAHPYLYRFWRALPAAGQIALYDRSWYGRVLVERVEGLCSRAQWLRAYAEIRQFERDLEARGVILVKFWLSVSRAEQLARFRERALNPAKRFKADPRDWSARRRWWEYQEAAHQALKATSRPAARWTIVPADDKHYARHAVLEAVCDRLRAVLGPL